MNGQNVNCKLLHLIADDRKDNNPSTPELPYVRGRGIYVLHSAQNVGLECTGL